jgi:hypothetical protein
MIDIFRLLLGILLLVIGRRFYWFFISTVGFIAGISISYYFIHNTSILIEILIALVAGVVGIILANLIQRIAIIAAGSLAGGYTFIGILNILNLQLGLPTWLLFIIGAVIGFTFMSIIFDWALIVFTSSMGALLISQNLPIPNHLVAGVFFILFFVGIILQYPYKKRRH